MTITAVVAIFLSFGGLVPVCRVYQVLLHFKTTKPEMFACNECLNAK